MGNRAWRRYVEERIVIRRLLKLHSCGHWWHFEDVNGFYNPYPTLLDFIGKEQAFRYKTHTTTKWDSKYKEKYSPNRTTGWRSKGQLRTREENKLLLHKILKEYGIK